MYFDKNSFPVCSEMAFADMAALDSTRPFGGERSTVNVTESTHHHVDITNKKLIIDAF